MLLKEKVIGILNVKLIRQIFLPLISQLKYLKSNALRVYNKDQSALHITLYEECSLEGTLEMTETKSELGL